MGMDLICPMKGICTDGHERADVKEHRIDGCCKPIAGLSGRIRPVETVPGCTAKRDCPGACDGKGCVHLGSPGASLAEGDSEVVMVFHDEAIVDANEGHHWGTKGDGFAARRRDNR